MNKELFTAACQLMTEDDHFCRMVGVELMACDISYAKVKLQLRDDHINAQGITHGGAIFTLMDMAAGVAMRNSGKVGVTLSTNITYLRPSSIGGTLYAEATLLNETRRINTFDVKLRNEEGTLLAVSQAMMYKKD
ncbi:MAG: PaaI family thioesterase [Deferribacteraceae bacterium]|jgi:acyl-CoA thioesterase|nr:PaaI family thioesterase [Deferribacteraceae bacterium]